MSISLNPSCYNCSETLILEVGKDVNRYENCTKCNASIRCCKMCEFYDKASYNECREPTSDRITDKEKANFCDFFKLSPGGDINQNIKESAISAAESLFKK